MKKNSVKYDKNHPFLAAVKERYSLCKPGSKKMTHHIVLDLSKSGLTYHVGDSIAIYPIHDHALVQQTLNAVGARGDESVTDRLGAVHTLRDFLSKKANITEVNRKIVQELAERQTNSEKKARLEYLLADGNRDALKEYQKNHEVWDALEDNSEVRFNIDEFVSMLQPMLPRFYSIASSMKVVGEEVHLTVSYVKYTSNGHLRLGVCSHYLCDMAPMNLSTVPVYIQPHHGFTLPDNSEADLILIGPGTGVAPYRAFLQERTAKGSKGRNWLFFGEWNRAYDYFYEEYWQELIAQGLLKVDTAFSRDQAHKIYVQHRMLEKAGELWQWIQNGAYIFVCGDAHRMAKDVEATLHQIIKEQGGLDDASTKAFIKQLRTDKRYLKDVY